MVLSPKRSAAVGTDLGRTGMRGKRYAVAALGACALLCTLAAPASASLPRRGANTPLPKVVATRILVKFKNPAVALDILRRNHDVSLGQTAGRVDVVQVRRGETYDRAIRRYRSRSD